MRWLALCLVFLAASAHAQMPGVTGDREFFLAQVVQEAATYGIPPEVADAVAVVETGYRPNAIGSSGEIGIMQILPSTAAALGFRGTVTELFEPNINIHLAVQYLARAWSESGGDVCRALTKYRAGLGTEITTPLSAQYCARAMAWLMGTGSKLGVLPQGVSPAPVAADPYVITLGPTKAAPMQAGTDLQPIPIMPNEPNHRRSMAQVAAALQARFDSHVRRLGDQATTSFDRDD
jgi:hypothetical protein